MSKSKPFSLAAITDEADRKIVDAIKSNFTDKSSGNRQLDAKHYEETYEGQGVTLAQAKATIKHDRRFTALFTAAAGEDAGVRMQDDTAIEEMHYTTNIVSGKLIVRAERANDAFNPRTKETSTNFLNTRVKIESPLTSGSFLTDIRRELRAHGETLLGGSK